MHITEVTRHNRRDVRDFLRLPFHIYHDTPQWVPALMPGERARFKPDFPFYRHSEAGFYLVRDDTGQAVGRMAVLNHRGWNAYKGRSDALIYLYESVDDDAVAQCLFDTAAEWARSHGLNRLLGPKGFLTGDGIGLLVEGFEYTPAIGIPYNPPYYVRHWEEIGGMSKEIDWVSFKASRAGYEYPPKLRQLAERVKKRRGFRVPEFTSTREVRGHLPALQRAYNSAFADLWAYVPIPDGDLRAVFERLFIVARPQMIKLVFKGEDVIGFQLAYPDISEAIKRQKGELWPFGWIDMLLEKNRTKWININGNAILPQYQGLGANLILYDEMAKTLLLSTKYEHADLVQIQESNVKMLGDIEDVVALEPYKRHRVYQRAL